MAKALLDRGTDVNHASEVRPARVLFLLLLLALWDWRSANEKRGWRGAVYGCSGVVARWVRCSQQCLLYLLARVMLYHGQRVTLCVTRNITVMGARVPPR